MVAILEAVLFVKPEWSYSQAHAHWHAFSAKLQLPGAAKAHMPKRSGDMNNRQPAPMLAAEVPILANVFMSLPNSCPQHLCECAAALYRHYNMESPTAFVYEPIASCNSSKTPQNDHQLPVATAVQGQSVANALPVMASSMAFPALASAIVPRIQSSSTSVAAGRPSNVSLALAAAMPQNAVAQIGHVFQNSTFCLRALQDVNGTLWFKGNEVAATLGYEDLNKAVRTHVHIDRRCKLLNLQFSRGGEMPPLTKYEQEATWVTESGVYQLLMASQTELGEQFRLWFSGEVLPQLARTGSYSIQPQLPTTSNDEFQALQFEQLAAQAATERQREAQLRVQTKLLRIELALKAKQAAQELGLSTTQALYEAAQFAIDAAALPANLSDDGFTTAGEYLRMRGHSEAQVRSLQVTLGHMLKKHYEQVHGVAPPGHFHAEFGGVIKTPYCYNRQTDRELLNGTYQLLTLTDTYRKQVSNELLAINSVA
jgi:prophage antirepressor-like protein